MSAYGYILHSHDEARYKAKEHYGLIKGLNQLNRDFIDDVYTKQTTEHVLEHDKDFYCFLWSEVRGEFSVDLDQPYSVTGVTLDNYKDKAREYYGQHRVLRSHKALWESYADAMHSTSGYEHLRASIHSYFLTELLDLAMRA